MANPGGGEGAAPTINWSFPASKQSHLPPKSPLFLGGGPNLPDNGHGSGNNSLFSGWSNYPYATSTGARKLHQRTPSTASLLPHGHPSWIDDLLSDAPAEKKGSHRRSSSDSVAFLDMPGASGTRIDEMAEEDEFADRNVAPVPSRGTHDFEKLDEEQLMSMFADIEPIPQKPHSLSPEVSSQVSAGGEKRSAMESPSPSDHNSVNEHHSIDDKGVEGFGASFQGEPEVESSPKVEHQASRGDSLALTMVPIDPTLDPKRAKRILANRQSAQRSRVRKLQYIAELERSVNALQAEVSALSPQVAYLDHQRVVLNVDNGALKQRIAALAQEKIFKDAHYDALKKEVQRLRQMYQQQQQMQQLQADVSYDLQQRHFGRLELCSLTASAKGTGAIPEESNAAAATVTGNSSTISNPRSPLLTSVGACGSMGLDNGKAMEVGLLDGRSSEYQLVQNL